MNPISRRSFLARSAVTAGVGLAAGTFRSTAWAAPAGANEAVRIAVIGLGSKGLSHLRQLAQRDDVRVAALCDVDPVRLQQAADELRTGHVSAFATTEARDVLSRPDVDAVLIATGNHWHALLTVWACQAGKDVYVEKPVSRTVWEGRKMVEAAKRYGRVVQSGTQSRSDPGIPELIEYLKAGNLGKIQWVHALWYKLREPIGRRLAWYPDWLDYDVYCGPAPMVPLERNELHYDWHWAWATGNGDLANLGIHQVDLARWITGNTRPPRRVLSLGGRYLRDDAAETPNTQLTLFDYPGVPIIFESRGLPAKPGVQYMDNLRGLRNGIVVQCEGGYYAGYTGGAVYDNNGAQIKKFAGDGGAGHVGNFLAAVRSRRTRDLAAPIDLGQGSTSSCLYGNVSYRVGHPAGFNEAQQAVEGFAPATEALAGIRQHLAVHGINLDQQPLTVGQWLQVEESDGIAAVEPGDESDLARARFLLRETQRPPYVIPEKV